MSKHLVKVLKSEFVTHNVKQFVVEKPTGYSFNSGQATDLSINTPELKDQLRPFTFTSVNEASYLEFTIKIYTAHHGITERLAKIEAGDELIVHDVFGTISFKGPGLFIAAGAGITPFISILRELKLQNMLKDNSLLFANRTVDDIILKDELKELLGNDYHDILENPGDGSTSGRFIDRELLAENINDRYKYYYICGPDKFTSSIVDNLQELGIDRAKIVIEE